MEIMDGFPISVVILTWNRKNDLMAALASVYRQSYEQIEVVVVDSASTDGTRETLLAAYPDLKYIQLPYNLGVIGGRNIGIANTKNDLILLLDDDAEFLDTDAFRRISDRFKNEPELAVIFFNYVLDNGEQWGWVFRYHHSPDLHGKGLYAPTFIGCAYCISREWLETVGYLKREFFREGEEIDYSYRLIANGGRIFYDPAIRVLHHLNPNQRIRADHRAYNLAHRTENELIHLGLGEALATLTWRLSSSLVYSLKERWFRGYLLGCWRLLMALPRILRSRDPLSPQALRLHRTLRSYAVIDYEAALDRSTSFLECVRVRGTSQVLGTISSPTKPNN